MCALCGVLGSDTHWSETGASSGPVSGHERRRARAERVTAANRILGPFGLRLSDWQGTSFVLSTATGKSEMVDSMAHLWPAAERLSGLVFDPLDPALFKRLDARRG